MTRAVSAPVSPETGLLPPREFWKINLEKHGRLQTPTDARGLVIIDELIEEVKQTIASDYEWDDSAREDVHHFYCPRANYPLNEDNSISLAHRFRELSIHQGLFSREFHNLVHAVTLPPPVPPEKTMQEVVDFYDVLQGLYYDAWESIRLERLAYKQMEDRERIESGKMQHPLDKRGLPKRLISDESIAKMDTRIWQALANIPQRLGALATMPEAFRVPGLRESDDPKQIARLLGGVVVPEAVVLSRRAIA